MPDEEICKTKATTTMAEFLGRLIRVFGEPMANRPARIRFVRGKYLLSTNPAVDSLNPRKGKPFGHKQIPPDTEFYVFTNTETEEKRDDLRSLVQLLEFPPDGDEISLID